MPKSNKKSDSNNHFKDLFLLFAIPIAIAVIAAFVVYVPRLLANPSYDFIYSTCEDYRCIDNYYVDSTGYATQDYSNSSSSGYYDQSANVRYYVSSNDSTRSLTPSEARKYQLNTSSKAPDGYTLVSENSGSGFLSWGDYDTGWYLKNGAKKKKVELTSTNSYTRNVKFLGWVNK